MMSDATKPAEYPKTAAGWFGAIGCAMPLLVLLSAVSVPVFLWQGYVLMILWRWFVVPPLGVGSLSLAHAAGICLITSFLCKGSDFIDYERSGIKQKPWQIMVIGGLIWPALILWIGFLLKWML